jgi:hypothetical protein
MVGPPNQLSTPQHSEAERQAALAYRPSVAAASDRIGVWSTRRTPSWAYDPGGVDGRWVGYGGDQPRATHAVAAALARPHRRVLLPDNDHE